MQCGCCGRQITGETKIKQTKSGERAYVYYRCTRYSEAGHPKTRVPERELDRQMLAIFDKMRIEDDAVRDWFRAVLISQTKDQQRAELSRQEALLVAQQDRLLNLRIEDQIDEPTFLRKQTELRDRLASIKLQMDALDRSHDETADLAVKVFELSQTLREKWLTADDAVKRRILEIVCLNSTLDDTTLCLTMRKPFDVLVEGLSVPLSGGNRTPVELFLEGARGLERADTAARRPAGRKLLNFGNLFCLSDLRQMTRRSVESSKSSV